LYDFLIDRADERFRIDLLAQNQILAIRCLAVMNSQLKFNICKIADPSLLNEEVGDVPNRYISEALRYSCHFFVQHLAVVQNLDTITGALEEFVSTHLLHWIEAMSWLGDITNAERSLQVLASWMKVSMKVLTGL
jgi:hypothetical protein